MKLFEFKSEESCRDCFFIYCEKELDEPCKSCNVPLKYAVMIERSGVPQISKYNFQDHMQKTGVGKGRKIKRTKKGKIEKNAIELGYVNVKEAVFALRKQGKKQREIAATLGASMGYIARTLYTKEN